MTQKASPAPKHAVGREHGEQRPLVLTTSLSSDPHHSYNLPKRQPGRSVSEPPKGFGGLSLTQNRAGNGLEIRLYLSHGDGQLLESRWFTVTEVSSTP